MPINLVRAARGAVLLAVRGSGGVAAGALRRRTVRRLRLIFIAGPLVALAVLFMISATAQLPVIVADGAVAWMFGSQDRQGAAATQPCAAPPPILAAALPAADDTDVGAAPVNTWPATGLDEHGRPTPEAMTVIDTIPTGASADTAQGWVLFRLGHPSDPGTADFGSFAATFDEVRRHLSAGASPLDVVATMDPFADYAPYLLLAQTNTYRLMVQGGVTHTAQQRDNLVEALGFTCEGGRAESGGRVKSP